MEKTQNFLLPSEYNFYFGELLAAAARHWNFDIKNFIIADQDGVEWITSNDVISDLILERLEPPKKKKKLNSQQKRNFSAISDHDGTPSVFIFPKPNVNDNNDLSKSPSCLGKRKRNSSSVSNQSRLNLSKDSNSENEIVSEPEISAPTRKMPPRTARTLARGRNRLIPQTTNKHKRRRRKKSNTKETIDDSSKETENTSGTSGTDSNTEELLLSRNLSYLTRKSVENLLPLFDDYENYFTNDNTRANSKTGSLNKIYYSMSDHSADEKPKSKIESSLNRGKTVSFLLNPLPKIPKFQRSKSISNLEKEDHSGTIASITPFSFPKNPFYDSPKIPNTKIQKTLDFCLSIPISIPSTTIESFPTSVPLPLA